MSSLSISFSFFNLYLTKLSSVNFSTTSALISLFKWYVTVDCDFSNSSLNCFLVRTWVKDKINAIFHGHSELGGEYPETEKEQPYGSKELIEEVSGMQYLLVPVGGGGILSGSAIAAKAMNPRITVIGVEPSNADDAYRSFKSGKLVPSVNPNTIADGLLTSLGDLTFEIIRNNVNDIITVKFS